MKTAALEAARAVLRQVEWSIWRESYQCCPACREAQKYGHHRECELSAALALIEKELTA